MAEQEVSMATVAVILLVAYLLFLRFVVSMYLSYMRRFLDRLRTEHQGEWLALDSPSLATSNFGLNFSKFRNYIVKRDYRALRDDELAELGDTARTYFFASLTLIGVFFLSCFMFMLLGQVSHGRH
jgi:hypothetical protein